ncbi:putative WRKY transcription factor 51 [Cucumis melo var. makuwa]|uniref:Putative WRKY transcription factor 51 n=1 Tax=Cucumis melo var. makuwa TaxID=1194695 RepID=A0A5D3CMB8_CUCMM|nr:putative WRKY transcription factor 51 [Cucumis melo var. makuwa]
MNSLQNPTFFFDHHQQLDQDSSSSFMDFLNFSGYPLPDFGLEAETTMFSLSEAGTGDGSRSMKATSIDNNTMQVTSMSF